MTHHRRRRYLSRIEVADSTLRPVGSASSLVCLFDGACGCLREQWEKKR
jgi:hypothetical protein